MKSIMKSIWYEIVHAKTLLFAFGGFVLFMAITGFSAAADATEGFTAGGASDVLAGHPWLPYEFPLLFLAMVVGYVCCEDQKDKVANYEILSGHSRKSIFFSRGLMAVLLGAVLTMILSFLPMLISLAVSGWGNKLGLMDVIVRQLLMLFPFLRLAAFLVVVAYLVKNPYVMIAIGIVICMSMAILGDMFRYSKSVFVSLFNLLLLSDYQSWSTYNVDPSIGVVRYYTYQSAVSPSLVIGTIAASLVMTAFYLFMGYALFRRDEMN